MVHGGPGFAGSLELPYKQGSLGGSRLQKAVGLGAGGKAGFSAWSCLSRKPWAPFQVSSFLLLERT